MNQQLYNIIVYLKDFNLKLNEMEIKRKEENKIKRKGEKDNAWKVNYVRKKKLSWKDLLYFCMEWIENINETHFLK